MAGALRKTMEYLGLQEAEERYDDYEDYDDRPAAAPEPEREETPRRTAEVTQLPQRTPVARSRCHRCWRRTRHWRWAHMRSSSRAPAAGRFPIPIT